MNIQDAVATAATTIAGRPVVNPFDPVVIAMIGTQICLIIAAVVQGVLAIMARGDRKDQTARIDSVAKDAATIKGHVNGEKSAQDTRLAAATVEITLLREQLLHEQTNAKLLAQAAATRQRGMTLTTAVPAPEPLIVAKLEAIDQNTAANPLIVAKLEAIDQNTAAIAENTAATPKK